MDRHCLLVHIWQINMPLHTDAYFIPVRLSPDDEKQDLGATTGNGVSRAVTASSDNWKPNLSVKARSYLKKLGIENPDSDLKTAKLVWMHVLAVGYSPAYLDDNADGIRQDWPRIPFPKSKKLLLESATLGEQIANTLDTDSLVKGVTAGNLRSELKGLASPARLRRAFSRKMPIGFDCGLGPFGAGWRNNARPRQANRA